jgi:hydroxymethylglutaryl-CoA lyase
VCLVQGKPAGLYTIESGDWSTPRFGAGLSAVFVYNLRTSRPSNREDANVSLRLPEAVEIVEVGPRDGLQNEPTVVPTAVKVEFIRRAIEAGLRRIEVASFVNPKRVPQMADAEAVLAALPRREDVHYIGLVLNRKGLDRAVAAGCTEIGMAVVASDTFNQRNQGVTTDESIAAWLDIARTAQAAGLRAQVTVSAAFGCPFEGEVPVTRVVEIAQRVAAAGPFEVALADTIGAGVPSQVTEIVGRVREALPGMPLRCHFHNTRNTGVANAYAALEAGVTVLDASIGGTGGCPFAPSATGNLPTEDLLYMLTRMGIHTGVDLEALIGTGHWLQEQLGRPVPGALLKAGVFPQPRTAG